MLRNYLLIAIRTFRHQRLNSSLNIAGLSLGLTCCLLIISHVKDELSYDQGFTKANRIFRVTSEGLGEDYRQWAATAPTLGVAMQEALPEIKQLARFHRPYPERIFSYTTASGAEKRFEEKNGFFADSTVTEVFDLPFSKGNPHTALAEVNAIVLSEALAQKYFGNADPLGKVIKDDREGRPLKVTGVFKEYPFQTHLQFDYLISMATFYAHADKALTENKGWSGFYNYVLLNSSEAKAAAEAKFPNFMVKYLGADSEEAKRELLATQRYHLQPITDIHLHSRLEKEMGPNSDITYVYIFALAALFILLVAAINFINMATALAFTRMKEVGVRKALGAYQRQLMGQFLGESLLLTSTAALIALILFNQVLPFYNQLAGKNLPFSSLFTFSNIGLVLLLVGLIGIVAGLYPAWFVSGFSPVNALKGQKNPDASANWVRKGLVVFQFVVSVFMIFGTVVTYQQMRFFQEKDLGFDKEQLVAVKVYGPMFKNIHLIWKEALKNLSVTGFTRVSGLPGERFGMEGVMPLSSPENGTGIRHLWADENLLPTLKISLKEGRNFFTPPTPRPKPAFLLNEAAVKALQLESPIGKVIVSGADTGEVVGIVQNFNFASLHAAVDPLVIVHNPFRAQYLLFKVQGKDLPGTLAHLKTTVAKLAPGALFSYSFVDEKLDRLYESENRVSNVFKVFAAFAIFISCLGLFGLSAYAAQLRTKEVGIRKVLGATTPGVIVLLSKEFLRLVLIATLLAWPLAWWTMNRWLKGFAYQITISWWIFALSGLAALLVALLTVGFQSIKAALANPVNSLRSE